MAGYIVATIGLAAGVTYAIVRISPSSRKAKNQKPKPTAG